MEVPERPSKTQRKREVEALQQIGVELVGLNADQLAQIELPEILHDAVVAAWHIRDFEGRRRQLQYIGRLMREVDPEPIRACLAQWHGVSYEHAARERAIEGWRARLLAEPQALDAFAAEFRAADVQALRTLIASVLRDQAAGRPPKQFRALFRALREIINQSQEEGTHHGDD
jgi:ribosome-associated protein